MSSFNKIFLLLSVLLTLPFFCFGVNDDEHIKCPPNITISCCQDYTDTNITGHPGTINNFYNYFTYSDSVGINECRVGTVKRTWTGNNEVGQFSCFQYIQMERTDIFTGNIDWPDDWSGSCSDVLPFSEPVYDIGFCDQVGHTFKDDTFRFDQNACIKILRNWKVIDWCVYKPNSNSNNGLWTHTQTLMILDKIPPIINDCEDKVIKAMNADCSADVTFKKEATDNNCGQSTNLKWIYEIDINSDWVIDSTITIYSNSPSITHKALPVGKHIVKWKVFDGCANVSTCMEKITVKDGKPPTLVCYIFTSANLIQGDDTLRLPAKHFVKEAFDNCTSKKDIVFSFSPEKKDSFLTFDCYDIGLQFLRIYAIDEAGNSDFVYILTRIQINEPCTFHSIRGAISDMHGMPMKDFILTMEGAGRIYTIGNTDEAGSFDIPYKENYFKPVLRFSPSNSLSSVIVEEDIMLLKDYLLGKANLTEIQKYAADLNNDGKLSSSDLKLMRKYYLDPGSYSEMTELAKFYIENNTEDQTLKEIEYISDFQDFLNIRCVVKGDLRSK